MNHRVLICGPEGAGRRTLFHALGGPLPRPSSLVFVDAFKRSLGDLRGVGGHIWIQLVHGGLESERLERERELIGIADAVIVLCDARVERREATRNALLRASFARRCVYAVTHARDDGAAERALASLGVEPSPRIGPNDPLGALAIMKAAARACATIPVRELVWQSFDRNPVTAPRSP